MEAPPFGFEKDPAYSMAMAGRIRAHATTHLVLGIGSPKSESWVDDWRDELGGCHTFGFGAGLDFFAGTAKRAPLWMRRWGLEWSWRFAREPRRLFHRYFVDAWLFLLAIGNDLVQVVEMIG